MPAFFVRSSPIVIALGLLPIGAHAQTRGQATSPAPGWDVAIVAGGLAGRGEVPERVRYSDSWFQSALVAVVVGRHWTAHLKTELELTASGEGHQFVERTITLPNVPYPLPYGSDQFTRLREAAASVTWQFFENQWVHPFVQAGVAIDVERQRLYTWPNSFYSGDPRAGPTQVIVINERREEPTTTTSARAVIGGGAKLYISPNIFVRADARAAFRSRLEHISFRAGMGFDF